jgi:hypothetical protein
MHEHTSVITRKVCEYTNVLMEARFEQMQSTMLSHVSALAMKSAMGAAAAPEAAADSQQASAQTPPGLLPDSSRTLPDSAQVQADAQREMGPVRVYSTEAGHMIRLSDAIRLSESRREAES